MTLPLILLFSTLCGFKVVSGVLSGPTNVRLTSYNMDLVLSWDPPEGNASGLLYTAQYNTTVTEYRVGCENISAHRCDFTSRGNAISEYGSYTGRVMALSGPDNSSWVESNQLTMDKSTIIGPPSVSLISNGPTIEVSITDPEFRITTLRKAYSYATYNLTYWVEGRRETAKSISNVQQNRIMLPEPKPWTKYCVQVQIHTEQNPKPSEPSNVACETTANEEVPWVAAVVAFVVMVIVVALVVTPVVYRKKISHILRPKDSLPQHLKEYLLEPPTSFVHIAMRNSQPPEEVCHQVSVVTDSRTVEEERPPEAEETNCSSQPDLKEEER